MIVLALIPSRAGADLQADAAAGTGGHLDYKVACVPPSLRWLYLNHEQTRPVREVMALAVNVLEGEHAGLG